MRGLGILLFFCFNSILNINSQTNNEYDKKGYLYYFGDTIECKCNNAYGIVQNKAVKSDFLWYSNCQGLECFFFCANNLSENIREKTLELIFRDSKTYEWKNVELDSAFNYFKKTYPKNINLLNIEEHIKMLKYLNIGQKSPNLSFRTLDNKNEFHLSDFRNKPVLLKLIGLDWGCHHESKLFEMNELLKEIVDENNTPAFKDVQILNIFMTNHRDEWMPAIIEPDKFKTTVFFANDPDSIYNLFDCMGGAVYLIDKNGIIASNRHHSIKGGLGSFEQHANLLMSNNWIYKPIDSPYRFAERLLKSSIKNSVTSDIFLPYDTLKKLDQKGYLRMHKIKTEQNYESDYKIKYIEILKTLNLFKKNKVVVEKINFKSVYEDNIADWIQIIFKVNNKDLYQLLIPNCINYNGKWQIFSGYPLYTKFRYKSPGINQSLE